MTLKTKDLRSLDKEDLMQKQQSIQKELFALNYQRKFGKVEKPARFSFLKKDLARIKTILVERERKST